MTQSDIREDEHTIMYAIYGNKKWRVIPTKGDARHNDTYRHCSIGQTSGFIATVKSVFFE